MLRYVAEYGRADSRVPYCFGVHLQEKSLTLQSAIESSNQRATWVSLLQVSCAYLIAIFNAGN